MINLYEIIDDEEVVCGRIVVDVFSDWTRFPRFGFLLEFGSEGSSEDISNSSFAPPWLANYKNKKSSI